MPGRNRRRLGRPRAGFSLLELEIAFVLFGIALAGIGPLVVMQSRHVKVLEDRLDEASTHYLVPSSDPWARKLGATALVEDTDPVPPTGPTPSPIDDAGVDYSEIDLGTVDFTTVINSNAFAGAFRSNNGGGTGDTGVWTFTGLEPGRYQVMVTYPDDASHATDAPYAVYDDTTLLATVDIDQQTAPAGPTLDGTDWDVLGTYTVTTGTLRIELSDDANGAIACDAVRIASIRNVVDVLSVIRSTTSETVTVRATVTTVP